eukprot:PhM_4_TR4100/c0_g1_i1/m.14966
MEQHKGVFDEIGAESKQHGIISNSTVEGIAKSRACCQIEVCDCCVHNLEEVNDTGAEIKGCIGKVIAHPEGLNPCRESFPVLCHEQGLYDLYMFRHTHDVEQRLRWHAGGHDVGVRIECLNIVCFAFALRDWLLRLVGGPNSRRSALWPHHFVNQWSRYGDEGFERNTTQNIETTAAARSFLGRRLARAMSCGVRRDAHDACRRVPRERQQRTHRNGCVALGERLQLRNTLRRCLEPLHSRGRERGFNLFDHRRGGAGRRGQCIAIRLGHDFVLQLEHHRGVVHGLELMAHGIVGKDKIGHL